MYWPITREQTVKNKHLSPTEKPTDRRKLKISIDHVLKVKPFINWIRTWKDLGDVQF